MVFYFISMIENEDDRDLAEKLYLANRKKVYQIALSYFKDTDKAEDGVCDVFERVCKNISMFCPLDCNKASALIVVYSRNLFTDQLRREKKISFDELDEDTLEYPNQMEDFVIGQDGYQRILASFNELDDKYADVCKLKYYVGLDDTEIAQVLGISHENVRIRIHRSKAMIRKQLAKEGIIV